MTTTTTARTIAIAKILDEVTGLIGDSLLEISSDANNAYEDGFTEWIHDPKLNAIRNQLREIHKTTESARELYQYKAEQLLK